MLKLFSTEYGVSLMYVMMCEFIYYVICGRRAAGSSDGKQMPSLLDTSRVTIKGPPNL